MTDILTAEQLAATLQVSLRQVQLMTQAGTLPYVLLGERLRRYVLADVLQALRAGKHADDDAVTQFAQAMRDRMAEKRDQGRDGWLTCDVGELQLKLIRSIADGDPIDIGNYAMMLHARGAGTEHALEQWVGLVLYEARSDRVVAHVTQLQRYAAVEVAARALVDDWESETGSIGAAIEGLAKVLRS